MKGLTAWIAGVALIGSLVAPALLSANQGEDRPGQVQTSQTIRYYPADATCVGMNHEAGVTYVPTGTTYTYSAATEAVPIAEPGMMIAGNRIYYICDNPQYDLSGSNESIYLVNDGSTYHASSARTATFAATVPTHVVAVPAEYRQDWLAVAAGDRPVRSIPAMGTVEVESSTPAQMTTSETTDHGVTYTDTGTKYVNRSSQTSHVTHHRKSHYKSTNTAFVEREPAQTEVVESEHVTATAAVVAATPEMGELFQIGNRWYMVKDGDWSRSDSWRGPFVPVKKGHVPREVRESAKRDHSFEE
jgi:hypothetical protein